MADENTPQQVPAQALKATIAFVKAHGKPARAVVENIGRKGARVVLVGGDGALGDVLVPSPATGEALVEKIDGLELSDWDRDAVAATKIGAAHRKKMAARTRG
ncbi:hypothetical protein [Actinokineospora iranica]|uniref:Uncharacterized protein n=1 Tax=Actinokineospora iranica TaxID=1271860 RepID=A0A1G6J8N2_9PSEU|nr:hypothetical protein [Actinokineospora iranica]SDC15148.1 hypothetical protein SAMN05216174_101292 [Actinokineospora iranica]